MFAILLLVSAMLATVNYSHSAKAVSEQTIEPEQRKIFYGCGVYESPIFIGKSVVHCGPLHNEVTGYLMNGTSTLIYSSPGTLIPSMVFTPDGRLFFTEKSTGAIRIMKDDKVLETPFVKITNTHSPGEQGMLGLTIDPDFEQNHFVYLYYTYEDDSGKPFNRIVRFTDENSKGTDMQILLDTIPASVNPAIHSGGALAFGPDGKLYVTVGDGFEAESAQDPSILTGKVLRINRDGTVPADNPWRWGNEPSRTYNNEVLDENTFSSFSITKRSKALHAEKDSTTKQTNQTSIKITINNSAEDVSFYRDYYEKHFDTIRDYEKKGRDWTGYNYLTFWINGSNDNSTLGVKIRDSDWDDRNEQYIVHNNFTGWKSFIIPLRETYPTMNFSSVRGIEFFFHKGWHTTINIDSVYLAVSTDPFAEKKNYSYVSPVYTIGHRNMFGIAFDKEGTGIVTENGPAYYDEINRIEKGRNYGWPVYQDSTNPPELSSSSIIPLRSYWNTIAPAQAIYYDGDKIPELDGKFVFAAFAGFAGNLYALEFDRDNKEIIREEVIRTDQDGVVASLAQSPDGDLYFGGSSIWKLERVDVDSRQFLFPVEISGPVELVTLFELIENEKRLFIDMRAQDIPSEVSIKIPRSLLDGIVTVQQGSKEADFTIDNSSPDYNIVHVRLASNQPLVIIGTTIIPEFPISGIVLAFSVLTFIVLTVLVRRKPSNRWI